MTHKLVFSGAKQVEIEKVIAQFNQEAGPVKQTAVQSLYFAEGDQYLYLQRIGSGKMQKAYIIMSGNKEEISQDIYDQAQEKNTLPETIQKQYEVFSYSFVGCIDTSRVVYNTIHETTTTLSINHYENSRVDIAVFIESPDEVQVTSFLDQLMQLTPLRETNQFQRLLINQKR